ncbi:unnamed protein product [Fraxinus pennsylvanica]|uniref:Uncharacterized protein n=1 Tax=Fraxinus pennsylvanica TaxID=56036 RepID=A0AAD2E469_9LAMI|nr:unnamed protein product [Fraxinus pennsylvanica]
MASRFRIWTGNGALVSINQLEYLVDYLTLVTTAKTSEKPLQGFVLVAREMFKSEPGHSCYSKSDSMPALVTPVDYTLVWCSDDGGDENFDTCGYFWPEKPQLEEIKCVCADLTDKCEPYRLTVNTHSTFLKVPLKVWSTRSLHRGMRGRGVSVGSFFCSGHWIPGEELDIACLKNLDNTLQAMPNLDQIHALIRLYGLIVFFHPDEAYLPSSVSWFFKNGALLFRNGDSFGVAIDSEGSNLPRGGTNDGEYWIHLPTDGRKESVKHFNLFQRFWVSRIALVRLWIIKPIA